MRDCGEVIGIGGGGNEGLWGGGERDEGDEKDEGGEYRIEKFKLIMPNYTLSLPLIAPNVPKLSYLQYLFNHF